MSLSPTVKFYIIFTDVLLPNIYFIFINLHFHFAILTYSRNKLWLFEKNWAIFFCLNRTWTKMLVILYNLMFVNVERKSIVFNVYDNI